MITITMPAKLPIRPRTTQFQPGSRALAVMALSKVVI